MFCEFCGKEGAYETIDPYLEEINEEIVNSIESVVIDPF